MKSSVILVCFVMIATVHCVIVDSIDPAPMDSIRRPIVNGIPAPSQWIGVDDFMKITQQGRLKDLDPKNVNADTILKEARVKRLSSKFSKRSLPTFESLGLNQDEAIAEAQNMLGMNLRNMKMDNVDWSKLSQKIQSLPKTVDEVGPPSNRTNARLLLINWKAVCGFLFCLALVLMVVLIIVAV